MDDLNAPSPPAPESPPPTVDLAPPPAPSFLHSVFVGPDGLRAGWRLLVYYVLCHALIYGAAQLLGFWRPSGPGRLWYYMWGELLLTLSAVIAALVMGRIEKRPFDIYGLPRQETFGKLFWVGLVWGLVAITALLVAMREAHVFYFGHIVLHGAKLIKFAAFWGVFFLLVGFYEEFYFRGYTLFTLTRGLRFINEFRAFPQNRGNDKLNFWIAAGLLSTAFGTVHLGNTGENGIGALAAGLIGLFFCLTVRRTGNLWFAVGFHASFDWGETYLYSVPNSGTTAPGHLLSSSFHGPPWLTGGSVGPEGSVLAFVLIAVVWLLFDRFYPQVKYPPQDEALVDREAASSPAV